MTTIVMPEYLAADLTEKARLSDETAGVLLAKVSNGRDTMRLLVQEVHWVPADQYIIRKPDQLSIRSGGYTPALRRAEQAEQVAIWLHTHPVGWPVNSVYDDEVDAQLAEVFAVRTGQDFYASMVVSPCSDGSFEFGGRLHLNGTISQIRRLSVIGQRFRFLSAVDTPTDSSVPKLFDRQVRAFGGDVQTVLQTLRVGVIGTGGTGSAVAEQLARLGVRNLTVVDPDVLEATNVTRVYGSTPQDVGLAKAEVLAAHLSRVSPQANIESIVGKTTNSTVADRLKNLDVIFGCSDDNAGRLILSRLAAYYLLPVIDCGVLLSSQDGTLLGIDGRVTILAPGYPCLACRNRIDMRRAAAEQLSPDERKRLQDEGYAPELGGIEPAIVSYTTMIASVAVAELLERLTGYGLTPAPSEIILRAHDREMSTNSRQPGPGHFCNPEARVIGSGDTTPFLGMTWADQS